MNVSSDAINSEVINPDVCRGQPFDPNGMHPALSCWIAAAITKQVDIQEEMEGIRWTLRDCCEVWQQNGQCATRNEASGSRIVLNRDEVNAKRLYVMGEWYSSKIIRKLTRAKIFEIIQEALAGFREDNELVGRIIKIREEVLRSFPPETIFDLNTIQQGCRALIERTSRLVDSVVNDGNRKFWLRVMRKLTESLTLKWTREAQENDPFNDALVHDMEQIKCEVLRKLPTEDVNDINEMGGRCKKLQEKAVGLIKLATSGDKADRNRYKAYMIRQGSKGCLAYAAKKIQSKSVISKDAREGIYKIFQDAYQKIKSIPKRLPLDAVDDPAVMKKLCDTLIDQANAGARLVYERAYAANYRHWGCGFVQNS